MTIDHICFAVKDLHKSVLDWNKAFGYEQMTEVVANTKQKVNVVFLSKKESLTIKLIEPFIDNESVKRFVKGGGGFHHICFRCNDVVEQMKDLKGRGLINLVEPQKGEAFDNELIAFLLTKFGINVELIDTDKKAHRLDL